MWGAREGRAALSQKRCADARALQTHAPASAHPSWSPASGGEHRSSPGEGGGGENRVLGTLPENIPRAAPGWSQDPSTAPRAPRPLLSIHTANCNPTGAKQPRGSGGRWAKATTVIKVESMFRGVRCPVPAPTPPPDRHGSPGARMGHGGERGWAEGLALCSHHLRGACNIRRRVVRDSLGDILRWTGRPGWYMLLNSPRRRCPTLATSPPPHLRAPWA